MNDGESWRAGDRTLTAILPPLFDSPVTRGLYDDRTGVYWAADAFATPLPGPMNDVSELDPAACSPQYTKKPLLHRQEP